jgi:hypothetical protein
MVRNGEDAAMRQDIALHCDRDCAAPSSGGERGVRPRRESSDRHRSRSGTRRAGASFSRRPAPSLAEQLGSAHAGPSVSRPSLSRYGLSPSG